MRKVFCLLALTAAMYLSPAGALAQTRLSGTCVCAADEQHMLVVGDREGHALGLAQGKCNWTKPIDFSGDKAKDAVFTHGIEAESRTSAFGGVLVVTTRGGDRVSFIYRATGESKKRTGEYSHLQGAFTLGDGTGQLKKATGKGTFRCILTPQGNVCDLEGEYRSGK